MPLLPININLMKRGSQLNRKIVHQLAKSLNLMQILKNWHMVLKINGTTNDTTKFYKLYNFLFRDFRKNTVFKIYN